jgi:ferredoxin
VTLLAGACGLAPEDEREARAKRRNRVAAGQRLACRVMVSGDLEVTTTYW